LGIKNKETKHLANNNIGYFGASTGAAAALIAAGERPNVIGAIVSRGGRPDLAGSGSLSRVRTPTLSIIGGDDKPVIGMNEEAFKQLTDLKHDLKERKIVSSRSHLSKEPGKLERVAQLAREWFDDNLQ
jgi:putative phosphoribosyl transferase